jgi:hypothetical protein
VVVECSDHGHHDRIELRARILDSYDFCEVEMSVEETIATRKTTHGSFVENARISQSIKTVIRESAGYAALTDVQREALDMFAAKICRILSGNPNEPDHWHDIAGYASLAEKELRQ